MARPNNAAAIGAWLDGKREAKAKFMALPVVTRNRALDVNAATAAAVVVGAQQRLIASPAVQTRNLLNHVKWSINKNTGVAKVGVTAGSTVLNVRPGVRKNVRVRGIVTAGIGGSARTSRGARIDIPARRAHLIEFGWSHAPAEPFMLPSTDAQKGPHLQRWRAAGREIERDLSGGGGLL